MLVTLILAESGALVNSQTVCKLSVGLVILAVLLVVVVYNV